MARSAAIDANPLRLNVSNGNGESEPIEIVLMSEEDLDVVLQIENRVYVDGWTRMIFKDCMRVGYHCYSLYSDKKLIGYGLFTSAVEEAHLLNIAIAPEFQGRGIGRQFLNVLMHLMQNSGAETLFLEVRSSATAAQSLYQKMGFSEIGRRKEYYVAMHGREDALVYSCTLESSLINQDLS